MNYKGNVFRYKLGFESWGIAFYIRENDSFGFVHFEVGNGEVWKRILFIHKLREFIHKLTSKVDK
jgi:hypothetical protein